MKSVKFGGICLVHRLQNRTKFGTFIDQALLYITSKIGELWFKGSPWAPKFTNG